MATTVSGIYVPRAGARRTAALFASCVPAGFPSPAEDYIEQKLDLNKHLIKHPAATFFVRVSGDSMIEAGIHDGDILIVDRAVEPADNRIVIAVLDGELTVKRMCRSDGRVLLLSGNESYPPIEIDLERDFEVWGVVTNVIHSV
jgi:DNA polymerase V